MRQRAERRFEIPPTAGLPLRAADLAWHRGEGAADFGKALATFLDVDAVQIECSGTAAVVVALTALRRLAPHRSEVVVPAYTCPLVPLAVARCGLTPRLCDLLPGSLDMNPAHLHRLCNERTLALVPTHLGGRISDISAAQTGARRVGAWIVEDAAQALGGRLGDASVGTRGDIGIFSLAVGKGLTIFEGGVLLAREPVLRDACRQVSTELVAHHRGWELRRSLELLGYALCYRPAVLDFVYGRPLRRALRRGDRVAAAGDDFDLEIPLHRVGRWRQTVGARALVRLPDFLDACAAQAWRRRAQLARVSGVQVLEDSANVPHARGTWPVLLLLLATPAARDWALDTLWGAGCGVSLPFVHALPDYARYAGVVPPSAPGDLRNARDLASRLLTISNSPWLDDGRFEWICGQLQRCAESAGDGLDW